MGNLNIKMKNWKIIISSRQVMYALENDVNTINVSCATESDCTYSLHYKHSTNAKVYGQIPFSVTDDGLTLTLKQTNIPEIGTYECSIWGAYTDERLKGSNTFEIFVRPNIYVT